MSEPIPGAPDASPERVGPYRIEGRLGSGGMGEVYRAWDERLERAVAIKKVLPREGREEKNRRRLWREARAAAQLNHPAIVQIYDLLESEEGDWIVMELVDGRTLHSLLEDRVIVETEAIALAREITDGLAAAHAQGLVHRDLKSENVMVTVEGRVKILDFGLAQSVSRRDPVRGRSMAQRMVSGTSRAMSPEQAMGYKLDPRSDLFSLGTLIYEMVTGQSPFLAPTSLETRTRVCQSRQVPASEVQPGISREMSNLIDHLLEKDPDRRPEDAEAVSVVLANLAGTSPMPPTLAHLVESGSVDGVVPVLHEPAKADDSSSTATRPLLGSLAELQASAAVASMAKRDTEGPRSTRRSKREVVDLRGSVSIRTLLFVGLVNQARLLKELGVSRASEIYGRYDRIARDLLQRWGGLEIDKAERFLFLFQRPFDAVRYAAVHMREVEELARKLELELETAAGIHTGEIYLYENPVEDVARGAKPLEAEGRTRVAAAHLVELAQPGQVLATQGVYELARWARIGSEPSAEEVGWRLVGTRRLKGLREDVQVYEVLPAEDGKTGLLAPTSLWSAVSSSGASTSYREVMVGLVRRILGLGPRPSDGGRRG